MPILLGDCHGMIDRYERIIKNLEGDGIQSILLGELGFQKEHNWFINSPYSTKNHKILFGNHDYFPYLNLSYSLGRFKNLPEYKMFAIAGGYSIDQQRRIEGLSWFREEEMNITEEMNCFKAYKKAKPEIVITHDGPMSAIDEIFNYSYKFPNGQRTNMYFENLLCYHRPRVWIFAHHHESRDKVIGNTRFICLDELETLDTEKI